jgi:hypothetical protein
MTERVDTGNKPKRTLTDEDIVIERIQSGRAIPTVRGGAVKPPGPHDPARRGPGHGDPDH